MIDDYGPNYASFDLPIVDGLAEHVGAPVTRSSTRRGRAGGQLAARARRAAGLMKRVSQIDVAIAHDAVVLLDQDPALVHVGEEQFVERLQGYLDLHEALHARVPDIEYVDLRFDDRVYVRPAKAGGGPERAARVRQ